MDGSKFLKIFAGLICALAICATATARPAEAHPNNGKASQQAKKKPKLTRVAAINAALGEGQRRAGRPVVVTRVRRENRNSFSLNIAWTKLLPIGTQDCSLSIGVRRGKKVFARSEKTIQCGLIQEHKDFRDRFQRGPGPKFCPSNLENSWNAKTDLIGRPFEEAVTIAAGQGCTVRVVSIDGVSQAVTDDLRYNRLNVNVEGPEQRIVEIDSVA